MNTNRLDALIVIALICSHCVKTFHILGVRAADRKQILNIGLLSPSFFVIMGYVQKHREVLHRLARLGAISLLHVRGGVKAGILKCC